MATAGRHWGIISITGTTVFESVVMQGFTKSITVEKATAKDETGKTINVKAYSKATSISCQGLLNASAPAIDAGATVILSGTTFLVDSVEQVEANTDFVRYNFTLSSEDGCVPEEYA